MDCPISSANKITQSTKQPEILSVNTKASVRKRKLFRWKSTLAESTLLDWMEIAGNYDLYRGAGKQKRNGKSGGSSGKTRMTVVKEICQYMQAHGVGAEIDHKMVKNKIESLETSWKDASRMIGQTGEGLDDRDSQCANFKDKILEKCPLWERLDPIFCQRPGMVPPYTGDNMEKEEDVQGSLLRNRSEGENAGQPDPSDWSGEDNLTDYSTDQQLEQDELDTNGKLPTMTNSRGKTTSRPWLHLKSSERDSDKKPKRSKNVNLSDILEDMMAYRKERDAEKDAITKEKLALSEKKVRFKHEEAESKLKVKALEAGNKRLMLLLECQRAGIILPGDL